MSQGSRYLGQGPKGGPEEVRGKKKEVIAGRYRVTEIRQKEPGRRGCKIVTP